MFDSEFLVLNITFNSRFYDRFSHTKVFDLSTTASFQIFPCDFSSSTSLKMFFPEQLSSLSSEGLCYDPLIFCGRTCIKSYSSYNFT